jgi:hypothetical protein
MAHQKVTSDFPTAELPQIRAGEEDRTLVISFEVPPLANSTPVLTNWAFSASLSAIEYFALSECRTVNLSLPTTMFEREMNSRRLICRP